MVQNASTNATVRMFRVNPDDGTTEHAITYRLVNCRISGYRDSATSPGVRGSEVIALDCPQVTMTDELNSVEFEWHVTAGESA